MSASSSEKQKQETLLLRVIRVAQILAEGEARTQDEADNTEEEDTIDAKTQT